MTEKQENILKAALQLFASEGFYATSTSKVAKHAGVSEGLIFRHFGNKDGLLNAILQQAEDKLKLLFMEIIMEDDPKKIIQKSLEIPVNVSKEDFNYWKLQYKLKWELEISSDKKMEPLFVSLTNAFKKLNFTSPEMEAQIVILFIDGLASSILKGSDIDSKQLVGFFLKKYDF